MIICYLRKNMMLGQEHLFLHTHKWHLNYSIRLKRIKCGAYLLKNINVTPLVACDLGFSPVIFRDLAEDSARLALKMENCAAMVRVSHAVYAIQML